MCTNTVSCCGSGWVGGWGGGGGGGGGRMVCTCYLRPGFQPRHWQEHPTAAVPGHRSTLPKDTAQPWSESRLASNSVRTVHAAGSMHTGSGKGCSLAGPQRAMPGHNQTLCIEPCGGEARRKLRRATRRDTETKEDEQILGRVF